MFHINYGPLDTPEYFREKYQNLGQFICIDIQSLTLRRIKTTPKFQILIKSDFGKASFLSASVTD